MATIYLIRLVKSKRGNELVQRSYNLVKQGSGYLYCVHDLLKNIYCGHKLRIHSHNLIQFLVLLNCGHVELDSTKTRERIITV